jgi:uncharacterized protein (TIGR03067 family)
LDPTRSRKCFDASVTEGAGTGKQPLGIYKLDGETLMGCVNMTGRERPAEFKLKEASDPAIVVAKRVKN